MDKMSIQGGKTFDLGKNGYFTAFEVEILSPRTARFYGEAENLHVTFANNIEGQSLANILNSNWDQMDLEKKHKNS